jgi:NTE family protein
MKSMSSRKNSAVLSSMTAVKTGLVLSGGGARGAYQAGVLKVLRDAGLSINMVSGASIGALNAGVLAAAPDFAAGVERVGRLWDELAEKSPLAPDYLGYLSFAARYAPSYLVYLSSAARAVATGRSFRDSLNLDWLNDEFSLLSDLPLRRLMEKYLDLEGLANGLPLYVSVFESEGALRDGLKAALAEIGAGDTPPSDFLHLQSLPREDWQDVLLASAALPGIFRAREIRGKSYVDGGLGGWRDMQGNTPVKPLADVGCGRIVVVHLSAGAAVNRGEFPGVDFIEICPDSGVFGSVTDMLDFDAGKIAMWRQTGEKDARRRLEPSRYGAAPLPAGRTDKRQGAGKDAGIVAKRARTGTAGKTTAKRNTSQKGKSHAH